MGPFEMATTLGVGFFLTVTAISVGLPVSRAFARRLDRRTASPPPEVLARLERMEQALDAVASDVERIAEGQRFTTKLLSERAGAANTSHGGGR